MAIKKPSEYFRPQKVKTSIDESVQEIQKSPELNTFSDAFESFKRNLNKIEILSEFSETLDNYRVNIERVNHLSEKVDDIQTEVKSLLKKEDLDQAMLSQLLVVEQSIREVQNKVKGINEKNLTEIRLDVAGLSESVEEFLTIEVPRYKKLVVESEIRINNKYETLEENVNQTLEGIGEFVDKKYDELTETLEGINQKSLSGIIEDFKILDQNVSKLKEEDIPKYKGFIVETERKTESKLIEFEEKLSETVSQVHDKIESIEIINSDTTDQLYKKIDEVEDLKKVVSEKIVDVEEYKNNINEKIVDLEVEVIRNEKHIRNQNNSIENIQEEFQQAVSKLQNKILNNEDYIKNQNNSIENIQEEFKQVVSKLQIEKLEEKNYELSKKIKYLEEVFDKFNQETLTEGLLNEPPEVKNSDPLTPLDKNFVTLDQLQQHYRLFINRIQQQLSTLGGGGETRLKYLDDIVGIATNPSAYDGKYLKYNHSIGKFEFVTVSGGGESYWISTNVGIHTLSNVGIGTTNPTSALTVLGDGYFTGVVTATTYYGDGSNLSNIISGVAVRKDDTVVGTGATTFNFTGAGVSSITVSAGIATINIPAPQKTTVYYTATEGQTTFTANYTVGFIDVYLNGSKLSQSQFTANDGTSVVLDIGASSGDVVELTGYTTFNVASSYASNAGVATYALVAGYASNSGFSTNSQLADVATVANTLIPNANVNTTGVITATAFVGDGSNLSGIVTNITAGDNITISSSSGNVTISASGGGGNWVSSGTTKVYTTSSVGIGILNPTYNLDVFGNINFTGTLFQNGTPFSGSKWLGDAAPTATIYRLSDVGVGLTNPIARLGASSFTLGNVGHSTSGIVTTTSSSTNQVLDSMPTATFRSARYQVSIACTGQLVGSATSSSTSSIGAITPGTFYIPGTYTNVPLTGGSGNDATANITVTGTSNNVGFTTTGNLLVVNATPSGIGTDQPIILASNVPNSTLTGTALTAGTIYYATGIGTTAFTVSYTSGGAAVAIGTTSFAGVGNTVTISGGVSIVAITSPGSGYGIGNTLTAATSNLGTVGSGFTCAIRNVVSNYQTSDLMILQSVGSASTSCDYIEYASLANNEILGTFNSDISGTNARLLFSPTYRNNTINLVRHSIVV